jgi:ribosomal protein L24E
MMMVFLRAEEHRYHMIKMYQKRITIRGISKTHRQIALRASPRAKLWTNPMKTSERQREKGRLL